MTDRVRALNKKNNRRFGEPNGGKNDCNICTVAMAMAGQFEI